MSLKCNKSEINLGKCLNNVAIKKCFFSFINKIFQLSHQTKILTTNSAILIFLLWYIDYYQTPNTTYYQRRLMVFGITKAHIHRLPYLLLPNAITKSYTYTVTQYYRLYLFHSVVQLRIQGGNDRAAAIPPPFKTIFKIFRKPLPQWKQNMIVWFISQRKKLYNYIITQKL